MSDKPKNGPSPAPPPESTYVSDKPQSAPPPGPPGPGPPPPPSFVQKKPKKQPPKTHGNASSAVPIGQMDAFVDDLVKQGMGLCFSVTDCNSFHTSGYLWARYAVQLLKLNKCKPGPIAIVNFDQHTDIGLGKSKFVASDRWGSTIVPALKDLGFNDSCYVTLFLGPTGGSSQMMISPQNTRNPTLLEPLKGMPDKGNYAAFWAGVQKHFSKNIRYVFISIDRDVLCNNYTQWGDGYFPYWTHLLSAMANVLKPLFPEFGPEKQANLKRGSGGNSVSTIESSQLIGMDICGLPELLSGKPPKRVNDKFKTLLDVQDKLAPKRVEKFLKNDALTVWADVQEELTEYLKFAHSLPRVSQEWLPAILFSGSVSYGFERNPKDATCDDFVNHVRKHLSKLLSNGKWRFILARHKPPVNRHCYKPFELYTPSVENLMSNKGAELGKPVPLKGFACTASVTAPGKVKPDRVPAADMMSLKNDFAPP